MFNQSLGSFIQKILTIDIYPLHTPYYTKNLDGDEPKSRCCMYYTSRDAHINQYLQRGFDIYYSHNIVQYSLRNP